MYYMLFKNQRSHKFNAVPECGTVIQKIGMVIEVNKNQSKMIGIKCVDRFRNNRLLTRWPLNGFFSD